MISLNVDFILFFYFFLQLWSRQNFNIKHNTRENIDLMSSGLPKIIQMKKSTIEKFSRKFRKRPNFWKPVFWENPFVSFGCSLSNYWKIRGFVGDLKVRFAVLFANIKTCIMTSCFALYFSWGNNSVKLIIWAKKQRNWFKLYKTL